MKCACGSSKPTHVCVMQKPKPPADLWAKMDAALQEVDSLLAPPRPPGSFTRVEFEAKYECTMAQANRRLQKLQRAGKIKQYGTTGRNVYYLFV